MKIVHFKSNLKAAAILIFVFNLAAITTFGQEAQSSKEIEKQQQKAAAKARKEQEKRDRAEREKAERAQMEEERAKILKIVDDEFSSDRKVTLLPQAVGPNLTVSMEYKRPKHRQLTMGEAITSIAQ